MKYGDQANQARDPMTHGEANPECDGVIAGLIVALAREGQPEGLPDLQDRLQRGLDKREAFCRNVGPFMPKGHGEQSPIADIVGGAVKPPDAIVAIWSRTSDDDALMRETIQTQLEATSRPPFDMVPPWR
jgi:hypothetical protein